MGQERIALPLTPEATHDFTVDWGDGASDHITSWDQWETTHTCAQAGIYTVKIEGTIEGWSFREGGLFTNDAQKMVELSQWGPLKLGNMGGYFQGAKNLEVTATDVLDLTGTTTLAFAFEGCESLTTVPGMEAWDVSNVTLSTSNYDALLNGWSTQPVQNGVKLGAGNSRYSSAAAVARQALIDDHNWSISDGAPSSSCAICLEPKVAFGDPITT